MQWSGGCGTGEWLGIPFPYDLARGHPQMLSLKHQWVPRGAKKQQSTQFSCEASLLYIFRHGLVITGEKRAVVCMQTFAKTLVQMGHVTYDEARAPCGRACALWAKFEDSLFVLFFSSGYFCGVCGLGPSCFLLRIGNCFGSCSKGKPKSWRQSHLKLE